MLTAILLILVLAASLGVMMSGSGHKARINAISVSIIIFIFSLFLFLNFRNNGFQEHGFTLPWIPGAGINFSFSLDGISLLMVILTTLLTPVIIISTSKFESHKLNLFYGLIFLMEAGLIGVFTARDLLVFYLFWEMTLIPAYFITAAWGGENRIHVTFKFFIYTLFGSLIMLSAIIFLYFQTGHPNSFSFETIYSAQLSAPQQAWVFFAFMLAFAIKIPIFPFHTWQPDTYTQSPAAGSILLAGLMLKMGIYGIIRLLIPITPEAIASYSIYIVLLAVAGIIYASVIALKQDDLKRLVAYVSIAHVGLISAGSLNPEINSIQGVVFQMFAHGINVAGLFILIDMIERRTGTRQISGLGGLAHQMPSLAILFMIVLLGNISLPLTNGFVGEFLILYGLFNYNVWIAVLAGLTIIFGAVYMLKMYQKVFLGSENPEFSASKPDRFEWLSLVPVCIIILATGVFPRIILRLTEPAVQQLLNSVNLNY